MATIPDTLGGKIPGHQDGGGDRGNRSGETGRYRDGYADWSG